MPKRSSSKKPRPAEDENQAAYRVVQEATREKPAPKPKRRKNPAAVALGRLGGLKGGVARSEKLTSERRREIATRAAKARWAKVNGNKERKGGP